MKRALRIGVIAAGAVLASGLLALVLLDAFPPRQWLAHRIGTSLGREVTIEDLELDLFRARPRMRLDELAIANPAWAGTGHAAGVGRIDVSVELLELLKGNLVLSHVIISGPRVDVLRDRQGRINLVERDGSPASSGPPDLPAIRRLMVEDGRLTVTDAQRDVFVQAAFAARETDHAGSGRFLLAGKGALNGQRFELELAGDALANVVPGAPWPFAARVAAAETRLVALGRIEQAFDLGRFDITLDLEGANLAELYRLTGLPLPDTPPYTLITHVSRDAKRYEIQRLSGTVGDSDVRGSAVIDVSGERPHLQAELRADMLDLDDLRTVLGAPPQTGPDETISEAQEALARGMQERKELLPRARLERDKLMSLDASLSLEAAEFRSTDLPIRAFAFDLELLDGRLSIDPLTLELKEGHARGRMSLDASADPPRTAVDLALSKIALGSLVRHAIEPEGAAEPALEGDLEGRIRLEGRGRSVHEAASSADGEITLVVPRGAVRRVFAELTGIDVAEALGLMLAEDKSQMGLRCGVAHFIVRDGTADLETMVFDTEDVLITGDGRIALREEQFDLEIEGRPKKPRLVRVRSGITIKGALRDPELGIEEENLLVQGAVGAALATLVTPVAALLAVVDPGLADDENCAALIAENRS